MIRQLLIILYCAPLVMAQTDGNHHLSTDVEIGSDGSVTQYILYDYSRGDRAVGLSSMILASLAKDGSQFLQFAAGPAIRGRRWFLSTYFGGAKGGRIILAALGGVDLPRKFKLIATSDPKIPIGDANLAPGIWFSRVWIGRGRFYLRHDNLHVAKLGNISSKAGIEARFPVKSRTEFYSFGHYDYRKRNKGITAGLRFRFL